MKRRKEGTQEGRQEGRSQPRNEGRNERWKQERKEQGRKERGAPGFQGATAPTERRSLGRVAHHHAQGAGRVDVEVSDQGIARIGSPSLLADASGCSLKRAATRPQDA